MTRSSLPYLSYDQLTAETRKLLRQLTHDFGTLVVEDSGVFLDQADGAVRLWAALAGERADPADAAMLAAIVANMPYPR